MVYIPKKRYFKHVLLGGVIVLLFLNTFLLAVLFAQESSAALITNPYVKKLLPTYRGFRELAVNITNLLYIPKMFGGADIPEYRLEIDTDDIRFLNANLPLPFSDEVLKGEVWLTEEYKKTVPAQFVHKGEVYEARVRYRGDNPNHWTRAKRSWQIKFKKENPFEGLRTLKLIIPDDREYFVEYTNNYRAKKFGLAPPESWYASLRVNGKDMGVYYVVEDFESAYLEKAGLPTDANLYATDNTTLLQNRDAVIFEDTAVWRKEVDDDLFPFENYAELTVLMDLLQQNDKTFWRDIPALVDLESLYRWNMVSMLAGSVHQGDRLASRGNLRMYVNNSAGKFEMIPWDVEQGTVINPTTHVLAQRILANPAFLARQKELLWNYVKDDQNLADDLAFYDKVSAEIRPHVYADFAKHDSNRAFDRKTRDARTLFSDLFYRIRGLFEDASLSGNITYDGQRDSIQIEITPAGWADFLLKTIRIPFENTFTGEVVVTKNGQEITRTFISSESEALLSDMGHTIRTMPRKEQEETFIISFRQIGKQTFPNIKKVEVVLVNTFTQEKETIKDALLADTRMFASFRDITKTPQEFVRDHPSFFLGRGGIVLAGVHTINEPIIIPQGSRLTILAGTTLRFGPRGSLISYSPIEARGTESAPIIFQGIDTQSTWGVVGIANTGEEKSVFEHARFVGGSEAHVNGIRFLGMLSSYHSDLEIKQSVIQDAQADDGINVKYAHAVVENNKFLKNSSDGIDLDFSRGVVAGNAFEKHGGDAIDLSGSALEIRANTIQNAADKCISIGEKSLGDVIVGNTLSGCAIGIEVKDSSTPKIRENEIIGNEIGVNAYRKKAVFGGGMPQMYNNIFKDNGKDTQSDEYSEIFVK